MERTYDIFVDNGLFILSKLISKKVQDINENDISNNIKLIANTVVEFTNIEKFSNLKSMMFPNSPLTQKKSQVTLEDKLREIVKLRGSEVCCKCGRHKVDLKNDINRAFIPNIIALKFYNFSNNIQVVNICSDCLILSVLSVVNCRVIDGAILFNSTSDKFMRFYTNKRYNEFLKLKLIGAKKEKLKKLELLRECLSYSDRYEEDCIEILTFNNAKAGGLSKSENINNRLLKAYENLVIEGLLNEFIEKNFLLDLIDNKIYNTYYRKVVKFKDGNYELNCSKELFDFLCKEMSGVSKKNFELINSICFKIKSKGLVQEAYKKINLIDTRTKFEDFLVELAKVYKGDGGENLFTLEEFVELVDNFNYKRNINLLTLKLLEIK